jgi:dephospho-CoA kinase
MVLVGITGGIGMGKSVSADALTDLSVPWVDTDDLARQLTKPGSEALGQIARVFGTDILDSLGNLRRDRLADLVFENPAARLQLEAILHPRIALSWRARVTQWRREGTPVAAVIIPLLYEKQYENDFSMVVCLACTRSTQTLRLRGRGWSDAQIGGRIAAQLSVSEKMERAGFVIWTEGSLMTHRLQWDRILRRIIPLPGESTCCPV